MILGLVLRVTGALIALVAALYIGDYISARYAIPGHRQTLGTVQVRTMTAVKLKNGNFDYTLGDTVDQTCVHSIFPQMGYTPCWYLSRHATRQITVTMAPAPQHATVLQARK